MPDLPAVHNPRKTRRLSEADRARRNQAKRCYQTNHPTWRRLRKWVLAREPLCRHCRERGRVTPATDVDHIDGDSYNNERSNLQALCKSCHTRKGNAAGEIGWQSNHDKTDDK